MVIKVDFDLTMSILAHNILRLFAMDLPGYSHNADYTLYKKFLSMTGTVKISKNEVAIYLKKKRNLPALLTAMGQYKNIQINIFGKRGLAFLGDSTS